jgi:Zn-dependent metalloprotease
MIYKKLLLICIQFLFLISFSFSQMYSGAMAAEKIAHSKLLRYENSKDFPSFIRFDADFQLSVNDLENWIKSNFTWDPELKLELVQSEKDILDRDLHRYIQSYKNIPIFASRWLVRSKDGNIISMNGSIFSQIEVDENIRIKKSSARQIALEHAGAEIYKWEIPAEEKLLKEIQSDPEATYYPIGSLVLIAEQQHFKSNVLRFAYAFEIYAHEPMSKNTYYIDAIDGKILFIENGIHIDDVQGTAETKYSGTRNITTDSTGPGNYRLREKGRGKGIQTYNLRQGTNYGNAVDFTDTDNYWDNFNAQKDEIASDVHWGTEMTYDFYFSNFNRNSIDGNGFLLISYLHYGNNYNNAFWDGNRMTYGDGNSSNEPLTALDIIAHEITHGLTNFTADLVYAMESGALNESFSDIFGTSVEWYAKASDANWTLGENTGRIIRNIQNPKSRGNPDTYKGIHWDSITYEVHKNSTVQSHWYYLLCNGGSGMNDLGNGYSVNAIGMHKAQSIAYMTLTTYLPPASDHYDARFYSIQAASDLYGECSDEVKEVLNAWYAVGVGGYTFDIAFSSSHSVNCAPPLTVEFQNKSDGFSSYIWDFGDGTQSSDPNPVHSYQDFGSYSVTLKAYSLCQNDSISKNNLVIINDSLRCRFFLNNISGNDISNLCNGLLYDDGGEDNYSPNSNLSFTIAPPNPGPLALKFNVFDYEDGFDYVYIYDGSDDSAPLLGAYTGQALPETGMILSTSNAVTIKQLTDPLKEGKGFELEWFCTDTLQAPIANFETSVKTSCTGIIAFRDKTFNAPHTWYWDFGDGHYSKEQNPVHVYTKSGTYDVKLMAENYTGTDSIIKSDCISIDLLEGEILANSFQNCGSTSTLLHASYQGKGDIVWYEEDDLFSIYDTGATINTGFLNTDKTYYVGAAIQAENIFTGLPDNNTGSGGYYNNNTFHALIFDTYQEFTLVSVKVYSNQAKERKVILKNADGYFLVDTNIFMNSGENRINLNIQVPVGTDLQLGVMPLANLYRNSGSVNYPIEVPGVLTIKESTAYPQYQGYYYYFYDWEISFPTCQTALTRVDVWIDTIPVADFDYLFDGQNAIFQNKSVSGREFHWDFGDGHSSTLENPSHSYDQSGTYNVTLGIINSCGQDSIVKKMQVNAIEEINNLSGIKLYPNPGTGLINLGFYALNDQPVEILIIDMLGKTIQREKMPAQRGENKMQLNFEAFEKGLYIIQIQGKESYKSLKFIHQ